MNGLRRNVATLWYEAKEMWFPVTRGIYSLLKKINLRPITKSYTVNTYARSLLKAHVQPVCIAVVHFTEIICCNTEITNVFLCLITGLHQFLLRRVSQPAIALGCEHTIRFSNTIRTFLISTFSKWFRWSARPQCTLVEGAPLKRLFPRKRDWKIPSERTSLSAAELSNSTFMQHCR